MFCPQCLALRDATPGDCCPRCKRALCRMQDENGAMSRDYLLARKACCGSGCRNCPYDPTRSDTRNSSQ